MFNAIAVTGNAIGDVMFYGRGAGKLPTASAVVADVIDIAKDLKRDHRNEWGPGAPDLVVSSDIVTSRWYVRAQAPVDQVRLACGDIQLLARAGAPAGELFDALVIVVLYKAFFLVRIVQTHAADASPRP